MEIELKKDNQSIYQKQFIYPKVENHGFRLEPFFIKTHQELEEFIDTYRVKTKENSYIIIRTKYVNQYDCWYIEKQ